VTENSKIYIGHITRFDSERHFGFVETENENSYFFFFEKTEQIQLKRQGLINKIHKFCSGDEVEFKLRPSQKDTNKTEAFDLRFIKNERREKLIEEANQSDNLLGYLKLIDNDKFFVKHISTYVFIPIDISDWETDLHETYTNRLDKLVNFKLTQTQKIDKLKAILTDMKFIDEYYELKSAIDNATILTATITGKNSQGLFATILNGHIDGFIPVSTNPDNFELLKFEKLRKGNNTNVKIKHIFNNKKVSLTLTENEQY
jgi:cold shock CspA family protein